MDGRRYAVLQYESMGRRWFRPPDGRAVRPCDLRDLFRRFSHIVERRSAASGYHVMDATFQIMLVVVIVAEKRRGNFVFLQHRNEGRHVWIIALTAGDGRERRMMCNYEAVLGRLVGLQVIFEPSSLLGPKSVPFTFCQCDVLNIAVDDNKVSVTPVKRVIRGRSHGIAPEQRP